MCDVNNYKEYLGRLEDYLEYVNTDVEDLMMWEPELYAAFGVHNGLAVENIKNWYMWAEELLITTGDPDDWVRARSDHYLSDERVWELVHERMDEGLIFECGGYWFATE